MSTADFPWLVSIYGSSGFQCAGAVISDRWIPAAASAPRSRPTPPNPSELLAADRLPELLDAVRSRFDFVLLDSPPVLPVADAVILGPLVDGLVLCARAGVLLRDDAKHCGERLRHAGLRIYGTVLNRYRSSTASPYSKRYRYYGAGEEETDSLSRADSAA